MYLEGEQVLAKSSGSDDYEKAKIVGVKGSKYVVKFKSGAERTIGEGDIKVNRSSRSTTKRQGKSRSPSRKSPSRRSPARKSPARKSPTRKSPARQSTASQSRKLPVRSAKQAKISIARLELSKDTSSDTDRTEESESTHDDFVEPGYSRLRESRPVTRRSIRVMTAKANQDRAVSLPVDRKNQYGRPSTDKERGSSIQEQDMFKGAQYDSDIEEVEIIETKDKKQKAKIILNKPQEWGGWFGSLLLILFMPASSLFFQLACSNDHCATKSFKIPHYKEWRLFLNLDAFFLITGFLGFIAIISALPIGRRAEGQRSRVGRLHYRVNGIWTLILTIIAFGAAVYYKYDIAGFLIKKSLPLTTIGYLYGLLLAIVLYIKGGRAPVSTLNIYGTTNSKIFNFWQGREVNPRIGPLDIKITLFRFAMIATIMINLAIIVKIIKGPEPLNLNNALLPAFVAASLQIFYCLDSLLFEGSFLSSFEITYEGTGYMLTTGYLMYPYFSTLLTRYLFLHRVYHSVYLLVAAVLCFICGYIIYRLSNSEKDKFRNNPFAPSLAHLETIPTNRGKKLIASGWWGTIRHPNYLGDIIMHWSVATLCILLDILPCIVAIQVTITLVHRASRDNKRCQQRYGYAWTEYCSRVKYILCKWVF